MNQQADQPVRVLELGRGLPDTGGIAAFLHHMSTGPFGPGFEVSTTNLAPQTAANNGTVSVQNIARTARDLIRVAIASRRADVVHFHSALAPTSTMLRAGAICTVARVMGSRVVVHAHGGRLPGWLEESDGAAMITRRALTFVSHIIAVASAVSEALDDVVTGDRVTLIPNGVDTSRFCPPERPRTQTRPTVLYVGHLSRRKGVLDLVQASKEALAAGADHQLVLVGGPADEGAEEAAAVRHAIGEDALVVGPLPLDEMPLVYQEADIFVLPSWWEAMPLSILEAMATGVPVIASNVGEIPRMVDGETGVLVSPQQPDQLAEALVQMITAPETRSRMGQTARLRATQRFSVATSDNEIGTVLAQVAGTSSRHRC